MAVYEPITFTKKGASLLSRVYLGSTLKFTKLILSDKLHEGQEDMQSVKQEFPITSFSYVDLDHLNIRSAGNNKTLKAGYFAKSLGICADDPVFGEILFCYTNADPADYIAAHNINQGVTDLEFNFSFAIKNVDSVVIEVQSQSYVLKTDFDEAIKLRPIRYLMDHFPQIQSEDYFLDLICNDYNDILNRIEALKATEEVILLDGDNELFKVIVDNKESNIENAKDNTGDIKSLSDIAIII